QVKSCVLAAGLYADGVTSVTEPFPSRDHTERMLLYLSADITTAGLTTRITGLKELEPKHIDVPGDISSAAFWIVAATIVEGSRVILRDVGLNPTRRGIIDVITRMGGNIKVLDLKEGVEPRADIEVRYARLKGTVVEENEIPLLIDEIPVLSVAAALAEGKTVIKGIKELKVKETDRVKGMVEALSALGASAAEEGDKLVIYGDTTFFKPANLKSRGDHRMAMSGSVAALVSEGVSTVSDTACVETSYPGFLSDMGRIAGSVYSIHP
ncbi:MAG: 3-phosphoshikimate 1-carboxyvinyltransferase, partial [Candidatus Omnitrophica bacterium]|nr:3-phosphoshikimate 1-carboxyvinyltransferase [Candidatus Omnitrophota bacterium]